MAKIRKPTKADISAMLSNDVVVRKIRNQTILSTVTVPRKMEGFRKVIFEHSNAKGEYKLESARATKVSDHYKLDNILFYALNTSC